jgi:uncharacterized DUF497 family protein
MLTIKEPVKFIWDQGNRDKNWRKHKVTNQECEEAFFDKKKIIYKDVFHSEDEERLIVIGKTEKGRLLYAVFTTRDEKIRVISARDINKKEVKFYEKAT